MSASATAPPGPPKLVNLYNVRTVATAKPCFICLKETTTCLANADVSDFLYSCVSHLTDRGFASPAPTSNPSSPGPSSPSPSISQSEIDKVTADYKAKQAAKSNPSPSPSSPSSSSKGWVSSALSAATTAGSAAFSAATSANDKLFPPPPPPAAPVAVAVPRQVVLQRSVFAMRVDQKRKAWQKGEARRRVEGLGLPSVPGGLPAKR